MSALPRSRSASTITSAILLIVGIGLIVFSLLADALGIGGGEGFGYQQMIVFIVGIVLTLGGLRLMFGPWINRITSSHDIAEPER